MDSFLELDQDSVRRIRKTAETPPRVSVYDVVSAITGLPTNGCLTVWTRLQEQFPDVATGCNFQFEGQGQRATPMWLMRRKYAIS